MKAQLTLESGSAIPSACTLHPDQPITLGRGLDNTIVLSDKCASKLHARIFTEGGRWLLRDLGSRNGVLVNGRRVRGEVELASEAEIGFGEIRFRFTADAAPAPASAAAPGGTGNRRLGFPVSRPRRPRTTKPCCSPTS